MTTRVSANAATTTVTTMDESSGTARHEDDAIVLLPEPFAVSAYDDVMTSFALLTMKQKNDQRVASDEASAAAAKEQEAAQAEKIAAMHELAEDGFTQGLIEGILEGSGAIASGAAAITQFRADTAVKESLDAKALTRDAGLLSAASKGLGAGSRFGGAIARRDQDLDREAITTLDAKIEHAKGAADAASAESRRAADDIRDLIGAIRQYLSAKTQLANASVFRG